MVILKKGLKNHSHAEIFWSLDSIYNSTGSRRLKWALEFGAKVSEPLIR